MKSLNTLATVGMFFGDEGKDKIINILSKDSDYIVRYIGAYANHSIYINDEKIKLNLLPVDVINENSIATYIFSAGVLLDLELLFQEIEKLENRGIKLKNIFIDERVNLIMPYHKLIDLAKKEHLGKSFISTNNGIAPCYNDKILRNGIRISDLLDFSIFEEKINKILIEKNDILKKYDGNLIEKKEIIEKYKNLSLKIKDMVIDTSFLLNEEINKGKKIVFEGVLGSMLDLDYGTYPNVSALNTTISSVFQSCGISHFKLKDVYGIMKSYVTRIDKGLLLTEIEGKEAEHFRVNGNEYMQDSGKFRTCAWLDLLLAKHSININGINKLVLTKLDVLSRLKEIKVAIAYDINGHIYQTYPGFNISKEKVEVIYKTFPGWDSDIRNIREYEKLPENAKRFVEYIQGYLDVKISLISVGGNKDEYILIED